MTKFAIIQNLISEGKTDIAIEELISFLKNRESKYLREAIILKSRFIEYNKLVIKGTISFEQKILIYNQINDSIIGILNIDENEELLIKSVNTNRKYKLRILYLSAMLIVLIPILLYLFNAFLNLKKYKEIVKGKEEYIQNLEFKSEEINKELSSVKKKDVIFNNLYEEFNSLHYKYINAIEKNELFLQTDILKSIHMLPEKYNLKDYIYERSKPNFGPNSLNYSAYKLDNQIGNYYVSFIKIDSNWYHNKNSYFFNWNEFDSIALELKNKHKENE